MTNNQLTAEQLVALQLRIMSALSFYQQRPEKEAKKMAELLTLAGAAASELQEHRKAAALHFQRGYGEGHSRGLTCGKLYKSDDQMRMHRAECVAAYKAELRGEESDE